MLLFLVDAGIGTFGPACGLSFSTILQLVIACRPIGVEIAATISDISGVHDKRI
jgi:hypothetical protein